MWSGILGSLCCLCHQPRSVQPSNLFHLDLQAALTASPPQHIRYLLTDPELLEKFTGLTNFLLSSGLSQLVRAVIYGGRLIALQKKDGGISPSPSATSGDGSQSSEPTNMHWTRCQESSYEFNLESALQEALRQLLTLLVNTWQTCQKAISWWRSTSPNAFNTLRQDTILDAIASEIHELYCFTYDNYMGSSHQSFEEYVVISGEEYQQGDPLVSLWFALTTFPIIKRLKSELRLDYLDDIWMVGLTQTVAADMGLLV